MRWLPVSSNRDEALAFLQLSKPRFDQGQSGLVERRIPKQLEIAENTVFSEVWERTTRKPIILLVVQAAISGSLYLYTHVFFGAMVAAIFTGRPEIVALVAVGSLIPDLDREHWFTRSDSFTEEQLHRSLFHNLLFIAVLFFLNQWIALGAFLHSLLDALTTAKDRGVEWLFPFSRLVKRGRYGYGTQFTEGKTILQMVDHFAQPSGQPVRTYFLNEDTIEMTKLSDPDLEETRPVPWRRTYGPALNGQLVDKWFAVGSFTILVLYYALHPPYMNQVQAYLTSNAWYSSAELGIGILLMYIGGELARHNRLRTVNHLIALAGLLLSVYAGAAILSIQVSELPFYGISAAVLSVEALAIWKYSTRGGRKAAV